MHVPAANIRLLTSEDKEKPTRDNIFAAIEHLRQRVKIDDTVFVYYITHGLQLSGETYLSVYDTQQGDAREIRASALSQRIFVNKLQSLLVTNLVVAFETCRTEIESAEKEDPDILETPLPLAANQKEFLLTEGPRNIALLCSSKPGTLSWEWLPKGWGFFSFALDQGLRGAAADETGTVRLKNLTAYLENAVQGTVLRERGSEQQPHFVLRGKQCADMVLTTGRTPGKGGATAVPALVADTPEARYEALFQKGAELYYQNRLSEALTGFQEALAVQPENPRVTMLLGATYMRMRQPKESEKFLRQTLQKAPDYVDAISNLAKMCQYQGNITEAETLYKRALKLSPNDAEIHFSYASLCVQNKQDLRQGERSLRRALQLAPFNPEIWGALGIVYAQNPKKVKEAEECLRHAVASLPDEPIYLRNLAKLLYQQKQANDEAEKLLRHAMERKPEDVVTLLDLAYFLRDVRKQDEEAAKIFRRALEIDPKNFYAVFGLAYYLANKKEYAEALQFYRRASELDRNDPDAIYGQAWALAALGHNEEALPLYREAVRLKPKERDHHASLIHCLIALKRLEEGREAAKQAKAQGFKLAPELEKILNGES